MDSGEVVACLSQHFAEAGMLTHGDGPRCTRTSRYPHEGYEPFFSGNVGKVRFTCALSDTIEVALCCKAGLCARDYVSAVVLANSFNNTYPAATASVTPLGDRTLAAALGIPDAPLGLMVTQHFVVGERMTNYLAKVIVAAVRACAEAMQESVERRLTSAPCSLNPARLIEKVPASHSPHPVTVARVAHWFAQRGVGDVPSDPDTSTVCLMMDGTPIDIVLSDPRQTIIKIAAPIATTDPIDPASVIHACNHANSISSLAGISATQDSTTWWMLSQVGFITGDCVSESQLNFIISQGVVAVASQLKQTLIDMKKR